MQVNTRQIVAGLNRRLRVYIHSLYWSSVSFLYRWKNIWPNVSAHQAAGVERQGKTSRKILVMMHSGRLNDLYIKCFETARRHCRDAIIEFFTDLNEEDRARLTPYRVTFHPIKTSDYRKKSVVLKIEVIKSLDLKYADKVIVSDLDVIFQADPFEVFDDNFDVFYTTRHYQYHYPINAGIWGFRVNDRTKKYIRFFIRQMFIRTWPALRQFCDKFGRPACGLGWYLDQDFLCTVYENLDRLPPEISDVRFFDAGYKYNFCPSYDIYGQAAVDELKSKVGNPDYKVLHLKAELKQILNVGELKKL